MACFVGQAKTAPSQDLNNLVLAIVEEVSRLPNHRNLRNFCYCTEKSVFTQKLGYISGRNCYVFGERALYFLGASSSINSLTTLRPYVGKFRVW
jgi:hypothetical protein